MHSNISIKCVNFNVRVVPFDVLEIGQPYRRADGRTLCQKVDANCSRIFGTDELTRESYRESVIPCQVNITYSDCKLLTKTTV